MEVNDIKSLLSEQRRELAAAEAIEIDQQVAYRLQMKEAKNASLSQFQSGSGEVSGLSDSDYFSDTGEITTVSQLFSQEIFDYEQRLLDHETAKKEMIRFENDIKRQNHDQTFARELLGIPEEQWTEYGDIIQKPFFDESIAVCREFVNLYSENSFRLHVKGLLSEETVLPSPGEGGKGEIFSAGIGIAVCDTKDALIFEVSKEVIGGELSYEAVELKALIEGLHVVNTLGLKRITIVCGNIFLYQCVTGKWHQPEAEEESSGSLTTLLDQVFDLQRKLTHCNVSLVEEKDVKFAYELAQNALAISQTILQKEDIIITEICDICAEDICIDEMFTIDGCGHRYCSDCLNKHVELKLLHQGHLFPHCPHVGCKTELNLELSRKFLKDELFDIMSQRVKEVSIPPADKIYCPNPYCSELMSISELSNQGTSAGIYIPMRTCTKCYRQFCVECRVPWHDRLPCQGYKRLNPYPPGDKMVMDLAENNHWRQCRNCKNVVSLIHGCNHIYCRCGHEFCYVCGAEWKKKKATCRCPLWDERMIIHNY